MNEEDRDNQSDVTHEDQNIDYEEPSERSNKPESGHEKTKNK